MHGGVGDSEPWRLVGAVSSVAEFRYTRARASIPWDDDVPLRAFNLGNSGDKGGHGASQAGRAMENVMSVRRVWLACNISLYT